jgi:hypothetical protein
MYPHHDQILCPSLHFKALKIVAFMAFFAVSAAAVGIGSQAAFTGNSWSTGTVTLRDNDTAKTLFSATNIAPGYTQSRCITVISDSPTATDLFMTGTGSGGELQAALKVTIEEGTGTQTGCGDFASTGVAQAAVSLTDFEDGTTSIPLALGQLDAAGGSKTFKLTVERPADQNSPDLQNKLVTYDFLWFNQVA